MQTLTPVNFVIEGDFVYFVAHAESPDNVYELWTDTFYIPDDTIEFQTYAADIRPHGLISKDGF